MADDTECYSCDEFWKDYKIIAKGLAKHHTQCAFSPDEFKELQTVGKIKAVPLLQQIMIAIENKINKLDSLPGNSGNDRQPFLDKGWKIWKLRWAVNNQGKSGGLRIMFATQDGGNVCFIFMDIKGSYKEADLQSETFARMKAFLAL